MDISNKIIQFENGEMTNKEVIVFFQELINSKLCWKLQGSYGRLARDLIVSGHCQKK